MSIHVTKWIARVRKPEGWHQHESKTKRTLIAVQPSGSSVSAMWTIFNVHVCFLSVQMLHRDFLVRPAVLHLRLDHQPCQHGKQERCDPFQCMFHESSFLSRGRSRLGISSPAPLWRLGLLLPVRLEIFEGVITHQPEEAGGEQGGKHFDSEDHRFSLSMPSTSTALHGCIHDGDWRKRYRWKLTNTMGIKTPAGLVLRKPLSCLTRKTKNAGRQDEGGILMTSKTIIPHR